MSGVPEPADDSHLLDFVETAAIGLHRVASDGTILWANESDYRPLGFSLEEYVGHNISEFHVDADTIADILRRLSSGERIHDYDARLRCKDGSIRHVKITSSVLFGKGGEFIHTRCFTRDVTEAKRMELVLERALADRERALELAEEAVRVRDVFLSVAAHELRTPLTPLRLQVDRTLRQVIDGGANADVAALAKNLGVAQRQVHRLERLVENLLDVSRLASGKLQLDLEPVDLVALARDSIERHRASADHAGVVVTIDEHAPVVGQWDRSRLEQIVDNLVANAVKYAASKPVSVSFVADVSRAAITVRDQGPGISDEDQRRIFGRFERAASARHFGGLGLGLWIVRQLVETFGGEIRVESRLGQGSAFTVELPRRVA